MDDDKVQQPQESLLTRLLGWWVSYRRGILVTLLTVLLTGFLLSLTPETRRALGRGLFQQRALVLLLLFFNLLVLSLLLSAGQRWDERLFRLLNLNGFHPVWMDRVMWIATQIGNGAFGIALGVLLYFAYSRLLAVELLLGILTLWLVVEVTKAIVERTRPFLALEGARVIGWRERGLSFPSGHTSQAFFMATLFVRHLHLDLPLALLLYAVAFVVGFTRIYVGAHYPRDVIGGAILGSVWGILLELVRAYLASSRSL